MRVRGQGHADGLLFVSIHERSRRSLRRCAAPIMGRQLVSVMQTGHQHKRATRNLSEPVVVVVEWLYYSKRMIIVRWADLSNFFLDFRR